jgi:hypothetical protein
MTNMPLEWYGRSRVTANALRGNFKPGLKLLESELHSVGDRNSFIPLSASFSCIILELTFGRFTISS